MSELEDSFALLLGRQPGDKERQRLYRVRDALKLKATDAVWLLLMVLGHYETLYETFPALIAAAAKDATKDIRETAVAQARAAAEDTKKALAFAVAEAATASAKRAAGAQWWKWAACWFVAATGCIAMIGHWEHSNGRSEGYANGREVARELYENTAAAASWANTPEGQLGYGLAKVGSLRELATCSGRGWMERDGVCYAGAKTRGWRLSAATVER
ncbi:MAG TPA: protein mobE [Polyangia bacterium]|nr:protein mobE [Polyangia bacterium]